jgi:hypothetical protein
MREEDCGLASTHWSLIMDERGTRMNMQQGLALYQRLRDKLVRLQSEPVPDMDAIDSVMAALDATQLALKADDGAPGNRPVY